MFTAKSTSVVFGTAVVLVYCATLGQGAPSMASSLDVWSEQSQPNHWDPSMIDLSASEKFPHEPPFELKPYWLRGPRHWYEVPEPSSELQPPPLPSETLATRNPDDQSTSEQVPYLGLENLVPDLPSEEDSYQDPDKQITDQTTEQLPEQVTEQAPEQVTEQVTEQVPEQATEQVPENFIEDDSYLSYMPEKVNGDPKSLSDSRQEDFDREYNKYLKSIMWFLKSPYFSKNWSSEKEREMVESSPLFRTRRSYDFSGDYSDSGEDGSRTYSGASASAGTGHDFAGISAFPTVDMFPQNQQQDYYYDTATFSTRSLFGGQPIQETGISARIGGPSRGSSSSASSTDDGNGKKTHFVSVKQF